MTRTPLHDTLVAATLALAIFTPGASDSTDLDWTSYTFRTGLGDADFNRATLARAR